MATNNMKFLESTSFTVSDGLMTADPDLRLISSLCNFTILVLEYLLLHDIAHYGIGVL